MRTPQWSYPGFPRGRSCQALDEAACNGSPSSIMLLSSRARQLRNKCMDIVFYF